MGQVESPIDDEQRVHLQILCDGLIPLGWEKPDFEYITSYSFDGLVMKSLFRGNMP